MFDSTAAHRVEAHSDPQLFHPKPMAFTRPTLTTAYSTPVFPVAVASSSFASPPSPTMGVMSATSSPSPPSYTAPQPSRPQAARSSSSSRPKLPKKTSSTATNKHKTVQVSLEVKVERSRGFHAFFVPLARGMPPAPPSSPVFGQSSNVAELPEVKPEQRKSGEEWVEDVGQRMDID